MAASGTGSLVFNYDATADKSSRMDSEVYKALLSAQIQSNDTTPIGWSFTHQPKHPMKATQELLKAATLSDKRVFTS